MGRILNDIIPGKLFCGLLVNSSPLFEEVQKALVEIFDAEVDLESPAFPFDFTPYYNKEMGEAIVRKYVFFDRLISPVELVDIKHRTNDVEIHFQDSSTGNRNVNIDPGYMMLSKVVLASTKDFRHRLYIDRGIYAEVTLHYKKGEGYKAWEWTFPDYREGVTLEFFNSAREEYRNQLRKGFF